MAEINIIRELRNLSEANKIMIDVINECTEICTDKKTKEKLMNAIKQVTSLSSSNNSVYQILTPDEAIIVLLLSFIREKEMNCANDSFDIDILNDASKWLADFKK